MVPAVPRLSLRAAASSAAERPALVFDSATLSYRQLLRHVEREYATLAATDRILPASAGVRTAVVGARDLGSLVRLYTLLECGIPFLLLHPAWTATERAEIVERFGIEVVLEEGEGGEQTASPAASHRLPSPTANRERIVAVVFTSGSSGQPKGAKLSERALLASARASESNLGWQRDDRWLLNLSPAHVGGLSVLSRCLLAHKTVIIDTAPHFEAESFAELVARQRPTILSLVPTMLARLLRLTPTWQPPAELRAVLLGGAAVSRAQLEEAVDRGWPVLTTYGLTEACSQVATQSYGAVNRGGIGPPLEGVSLRAGSAAAPATVEIKGDMLFSGYLGEGPPVLSKDGYFATGDCGFVDSEGSLHLVGRESDVIVTGGENVHPRQVEEVVEAFEGIAAACVFGVADEEWGHKIAVLVEGQPLGEATERQLLLHMADRLATFRRPRFLAYCNELPRVQNGKIDRAAAAVSWDRKRLRPLRYG